MDGLLTRISSYNLLNNVFTGAIFCLFMFYPCEIEKYFGKSTSNILIAYYFIGLVLYQVGTLFVEPLYKRIGIVEYVEYKFYLDAEKIDSKISSMSAENNFYRTLVVVFLILFICSLCHPVKVTINFGCCYGRIGIVALIVLFSYAYSKRTYYIRSRVEHSILKKEDIDNDKL